jgi:TRAP-type C4-dicarboxylate transport system permease small subunit
MCGRKNMEHVTTHFRKTVNILERILNPITVIIHWTLSAFLFALLTAVFLTVLFRYALHKPLDWSSELARFLFVWISFLGMLEGVRLKAHIGITIIVDAFPREARRTLEIVINILIIIFLLVIIKEGIRLTGMNMDLLSPGLNIPEGWVYISIPLSCGLMIPYLILQMINGSTDSSLGKNE